MPFPSEALLFVFLIVTAILVARLTNLFAAAMLTGMFSLLSACLFTMMDAVDVAFTEASVGAGISTVLVLGTLALSAKKEYQQPTRMPPFIVVALTGIALMVGTFDMAPYGDPTAPIHTQVSKQYLEREYQAYRALKAQHAAHDAKTDGHGAEAEKAPDHPKQVGLPNVVTSILASYRGYDTLGETAVVFTAGVGVMLLLGRRRRESDDEEGHGAPDDDAPPPPDADAPGEATEASAGEDAGGEAAAEAAQRDTAADEDAGGEDAEETAEKAAQRDTAADDEGAS